MAIEILPEEPVSAIDQAKESIRTAITATLKKEFTIITAAELKIQKNPVTSLSGRAAFAQLIGEKQKAEDDAKKVVAFKARYAKWILDKEPPDELTADSLGFIQEDV